MRKSAGFTLIEVMVVVVILGILAAIVVPQIMNRPDQAKQIKAKQDILAIENALDLYKLDNGFYPSTDQGLQALMAEPDTAPLPRHWKQGGYLKRLPMDPWDREYQYLNPGEHSAIDIFTYGANGVADGEGIDAQIGNWSNENKNSAEE